MVVVRGAVDLDLSSLPPPRPGFLVVCGRRRGFRVVLGGGVKGVQGMVPPTGCMGVGVAREGGPRGRPGPLLVVLATVATVV